MSKVLLVALVLLCLAFSANAASRKNFLSARDRAHALRRRAGPSDMTEAQSIFDKSIKPTIEADLAKIANTAAAERQFYVDTSNNINSLVKTATGLDPKNTAALEPDNADKIAKLCYLARHHLRVRVREHQAARGVCAAIMVFLLRARDLYEYGRTDGPTFQDLVKKAGGDATSKTALKADVYAKIVGSSARTNKKVNAAMSVKGETGGEKAPSDWDASAAAKEVATQLKQSAPSGDETKSGKMETCTVEDRNGAYTLYKAIKGDVKSSDADGDGDSI